MRETKLDRAQVDVVAVVLREGLEAQRQKIVGSLALAPVRAGWQEARAAVDAFLETLDDPDGRRIIVVPRNAPPGPPGHVVIGP